MDSSPVRFSFSWNVWLATLIEITVNEIKAGDLRPLAVYLRSLHYKICTNGDLFGLNRQGTGRFDPHLGYYRLYIYLCIYTMEDNILPLKFPIRQCHTALDVRCRRIIYIKKNGNYCRPEMSQINPNRNHSWFRNTVESFSNKFRHYPGNGIQKSNERNFSFRFMNFYNSGLFPPREINMQMTLN